MDAFTQTQSQSERYKGNTVFPWAISVKYGWELFNRDICQYKCQMKSPLSQKPASLHTEAVVAMGCFTSQSHIPPKTLHCLAFDLKCHYILCCQSISCFPQWNISEAVPFTTLHCWSMTTATIKREWKCILIIISISEHHPLIDLRVMTI